MATFQLLTGAGSPGGGVESVTAGDASITVGGTATNPTVALPYKLYTALLTYADVDQPPTVNAVAQNTLGGTVVWSFDNGHWVATLAGAFAGTVVGFTSSGCWTTVTKINNDSVRLQVFNESFAEDIGYWTDNASITIQVYPV